MTSEDGEAIFTPQRAPGKRCEAETASSPHSRVSQTCTLALRRRDAAERGGEVASAGDTGDGAACAALPDAADADDAALPP